MARPKMCAKRPSVPTDPSRSLPGAEGQQVMAASVQEKNKQVVAVGNSTASVVQEHVRPLVSQRRTADLQTKIDDFFKPALGEKLPPETPMSGTLWTFPGAKDLQAIAPAGGVGTPSAKEEFSHSSEGSDDLFDLEWQKIVERAFLEEEHQPAHQCLAPAAPASPSMSTEEEHQSANLSLSQAVPPSPSMSPAAVVEKKPRAARGLHLSHAELVSDKHLRLKEKAAKLGVSVSLFKNRRRRAGLGKWRGRQERAEIKSKEAEVRRA